MSERESHLPLIRVFGQWVLSEHAVLVADDERVLGLRTQTSRPGYSAGLRPVTGVAHDAFLTSKRTSPSRLR